MAAVKEPNGLIAGSHLRPDGATYTPWVRGKCLVWDFTSPDTLAPSHISATSSTGGAAAAQASDLKINKYRALQPSHHFVAVAIETLGPWNTEGLALIKELGRRIEAVTGDKRETSFLLQRLSMAFQLSNVAFITGTLPVSEFTSTANDK